MTVILDPNQFRAISRELTTGLLVSKGPLTLVDGEQTLFNITGGNVLLTHFVGEVTTAITVANAAKIVYDPTTGGADVDLTSTLDIGTTDSAVGSYFTLNPTIGSALVKTLDYTAAARLAAPLVLRTGAIHLNNAGTGTDGAVTWRVIYTPLDTGAAIAAA